MEIVRIRKLFLLEVAFDKGYTIQMSFDIQNYLEQIPTLQNVLKQTENFLKEIPFPISIMALDNCCLWIYIVGEQMCNPIFFLLVDGKE